MIILFIVGLLLGMVAVIFALQNVAIITVTLFSWSITGSLSVIILLAIISGFLIAILLILPESISNFFKYRGLKKENHKLEEALRQQKEKTVFTKTTPPTESDIAKIENGASDEHPL